MGAKREPDYRGRLRGLRTLLGDKLDAILVSDLKNARYLSGFTGSNAFIVVTHDEAFFLTDPRYTAQAREEVKGFKIRIFRKALDEISALVLEKRIKALGFEAPNLNYASYRKLAKALPKVRLRPADGLIERLRERKDLFEVEKIRASANLLDVGFRKAARLVRAGAIESEAAFSIEVDLRRKGAEAMAFDTIIASGERGSLPHGRASGKRIKKGELVVVDMGVLMDGYNSDETRTFAAGKLKPRQREIYGIVKDAQSAAIDAIRPGRRASEVDGAARKVIEKAGYGKFFGHGTGHGVGLDIHERPSLGPLSEDVLDEGMVVTIEPGIYLPGYAGVRIEDMALVVKGGCELLTKTAKELIEV
ncbi:MAG: aminopeptidase P family protein [Deltaproteobacteria bacterium]|nr:aminopeptidase P family protein [Deltaproteobacteria bacterium]MBZ0221249.1 Xaa-Pro peptidase family protein [Deltaproteobacteria bacterium]